MTDQYRLSSLRFDGGPTSELKQSTKFLCGPVFLGYPALTDRTNFLSLFLLTSKERSAQRHGTPPQGKVRHHVVPFKFIFFLSFFHFENPA